MKKYENPQLEISSKKTFFKNESEEDLVKILEELNKSVEPEILKNIIRENKSIHFAKEFKTGDNNEQYLSIDSKYPNLTKACHNYPEMQLRKNDKALRKSVVAKHDFSEQDFISLLLFKLLENGISKIDTMKLKYILADYYFEEEYACLFEDLSLKEQIEGSFVELDDALVFAHFAGLLSNPIQGTNTRMIWSPLEDISSNYPMEYNLKMNKLVNDYSQKISSEKLRKAKLNYMSATSKTETVAKIPVDGSKLEELDMSIREKCKQNHSNDHTIEVDGIHYVSNFCEQGPVKKLVPNKKSNHIY